MTKRKNPAEATRTVTSSGWDLGTAPPPPEGLALVVAWAADEPWRVGEVLWLSTAPACFGRGEASADDPHPRVFPARQRPGVLEAGQPWRGRATSRVQLILQVDGEAVALRNVGKCPLRVGGVEVSEASVGVGEVCELHNQAVLICVSRPRRFEAGTLPLHAFGGPDAYGIVGESPAIWALRERVAFLGPRRAHVLVHGESGSGKELVARALHASAGGTFVARNAATLPEGLVDAELFGNARNYPNPGMAAREGLVGAADGGTLFLDEFAELPPALQTHLLRVLDDGEYHRLGESAARRANLRLIGATNRPLTEIREDVLARLPLRVEVPPLQDRREDIPLLARHLLTQIAEEDPTVGRRFFATGQGAPVPRFTPRLVCGLLQRRYTTHAREVVAVLWKAMAEARGDVLDLPRDQPQTDSRLAPTPDAPVDFAAWHGAEVSDIPPEVIQACLDHHNGRQEEAWVTLGLSSRYVLRRLIRKHGLVVTRGARRASKL